MDEELGGEFLKVLGNPELDAKGRANALLELQQKFEQKASERGSQEWNNLQKEWHDAVMADASVGGQNWAKSEAAIAGLLNKYGTPELRQVFDLTGAGNNVEMVRFLTKIAADLSEGTLPNTPPGPAGTQGGTLEERAEQLYPSMKKA